MGAELPHIPGGTDVVLYPASARASGDLQNSLEASGFSVNCIRTYDTVGVKNVDPEWLQQAINADAVTFGSPSAVK
jgi:uroporphyrinogen-III synthase